MNVSEMLKNQNQEIEYLSGAKFKLYKDKVVFVSGGGTNLQSLIDAINDGYKRLIAPSLENELRNELTLKAEDGALYIFKANQIIPFNDYSIIKWFAVYHMHPTSTCKIISFCNMIYCRPQRIVMCHNFPFHC